MSDDIIAKAVAQIAEHERTAAHHSSEAARLKSFVNQYDQLAGCEPRYTDVSATTVAAATLAAAGSGVFLARAWNAGDFFGKPFATAAKTILQARYDVASKPAPATVEEIRDALLQGTYDFGTSNADAQKQGIRIALGKNTAVFVRLPGSDLFGLVDWYGNRPRRVRARLNGEQSAEASDAADDVGGEEEAADPPAAPIDRRM